MPTFRWMSNSVLLLKLGVPTPTKERGWLPLPKRTRGEGDGRSYFGEGVVDGLFLFAVGEGVGPTPGT